MIKSSVPDTIYFAFRNDQSVVSSGKMKMLWAIVTIPTSFE